MNNNNNNASLIANTQPHLSLQVNTDNNTNMLVVKRQLKEISNVRSFASTSLISILVPPKTQIGKLSQMINEELSTASCIKQRVNRLLVTDALKSLQQKVKLVTKIPLNGLVFYCGTADVNGVAKKYNLMFEPPSPVPTFIYRCDNKFYTEAVEQMLMTHDKYGVIVIDGHETVFGVICGDDARIIHRFKVHLPKKHRRGGQSSVRFANLRV